MTSIVCSQIRQEAGKRRVNRESAAERLQRMPAASPDGSLVASLGLKTPSRARDSRGPGFAAASNQEGSPFRLRSRLLKQSLLLFFLALNTVARPRHGVQAFLLHLAAARHAYSVFPVLHSLQGLLDQV